MTANFSPAAASAFKSPHLAGLIVRALVFNFGLFELAQNGGHGCIGAGSWIIVAIAFSSYPPDNQIGFTPWIRHDRSLSA
jgi:hypothetical protein